MPDLMLDKEWSFSFYMKEIIESVYFCVIYNSKLMKIKIECKSEGYNCFKWVNVMTLSIPYWHRPRVTLVRFVIWIKLELIFLYYKITGLSANLIKVNLVKSKLISQIVKDKHTHMLQQKKGVLCTSWTYAPSGVW